VRIDARESSQLLSALLMVVPVAAASVDVTLVSDVRWSFIEMTLRLIASLACASNIRRGDPFFGRACALRFARQLSIEPDATAASYFQALSLITRGDLILPGLRPPGAGLQGDSTFAEVMNRTWSLPAGISHRENFYEISDTFLTLAAITPLLEGITKITGIAHTRKQETDRVAGMARELIKLGQEVVEEEDSLTIIPTSKNCGGARRKRRSKSKPTATTGSQ